MEDHTTYWILFKGFHHTIGLWGNKTYRHAKGEFKRNPANRFWICSLCGKKIKHKQLTIDHIIPANIIWQVELPGLLFDQRNFRATHRTCNESRGELTINDLPPKLRDKLFIIAKNINTPTTEKEPVGSPSVIIA